MAYQIYLIEDLKTQNSTATFTGTSDINITSGYCYLQSVPRMELRTGMYIYISGSRYTIEKYSYTDITETYKLSLYPNVLAGNYTDQSWQIFDYSSVENYAELDVESIDLEVEYKIADISDITSRTDTITKNIQLKGTPANNLAFGNLFFLNKRTDLNISNLLGFNFNSIKPADCLIYEDSNLILRGNLFVTEINKDKNNNLVYNTTVTGKLTGLKSILGEVLLSDLDLSDLRHSYDALTIVDSWGAKNSGGEYSYGNSQTTMFNNASNSFYQVPFSYGKNYVYGLIDYGEKFVSANDNLTYYHTPLYNYRPAIYVREYLNRIFDQNNLSYEILGSSQFLNEFDRLIIPDSQKQLSTQFKGITDRYLKTTAQTNSFNNINQDGNKRRVYPIQWDEQDLNLLTDYFPFPYPFYVEDIDVENRRNNILICQRNFSGEGRVTVAGEFISLTSDSSDSAIIIQLGKRENTTDEATDFTSVAETVLQGQQGVSTLFDVTLDIPNTEFKKGEQLQLRIIRPYFASDESYNISYFNITAAELTFGKDLNSITTANTEIGDHIVPSAPSEIKQLDFIKGLISLFNFYVFTKKDNPRKYYFQQYDNYYALATTNNLKNQALDWTMKIDHGQNWKWKSNLQLPKNYKFQFKSDADVLNKNYNDSFRQPYGSLNFSDSLGLSSDKTVEPLFSPTISASIAGVDRLSPFIVDGSTSLTSKQTIKSNIRILFYSGVHASPSDMRFAVDAPYGGGLVWDTSEVFSTNWQPVVSNYLYDSSSDIFHSPYDVDGSAKDWKPVRDIHFSSPKSFNFNPTQDYFGVKNSYGYYINQISELTNPNLYTIELFVLLNSFDVSNLDLKTPVFIDSGEFGYSYFKVLSVVYGGENKPSKITLQKIPM